MAASARPIRVSPVERRWAVGAAIGLMAVLSLPYALAWVSTPADGVFMGHIWNPDDPCVYMAWARQAADGRLLLQDLFTTETQDGRYTNLFFLVIGWISRLSGLSIGAVYAGSRFVCGVALLYTTYLAAAAFSRRRAVRRLALYLVATASGLGWLFRLADMAWPGFLGGVACVDIAYTGGQGDAITLAMPELVPTMSLLLHPHFALSMSLLLVTVVWGWRALSGGGRRDSVMAGVAALLLGNVHTYDVIPAALTLLVLAALAWTRDRARWRQVVSSLATIALLALPPVAYQAFVFQTDPVFRQKALTVTASPSVLSYMVSMGLPLLAAVAASISAVRRRRRHWYPLVTWAAVACAIPFMPGLSFQRKMVEGAYLPLCILAAWIVAERAIPALQRRLPGRRRARLQAATRLVALVTVAACLPSLVVFTQRALSTVADNNRSRHLPPYYMARDDVACMAWMGGSEGSRITPDAVVLLSPLSAAYLPGVAGCKIYAGHWSETLDYPRKVAEVAAVLSGRVSGDEARRLVESSGARWLLWGVVERALFGDPGAFLEAVPHRVVHQEGQCTLYELLIGR